MPIGLAVAGPLAVLLGLRPALWVALMVMAALEIVIVAYSSLSSSIFIKIPS
jgi:glycerol-3-phosphate acyltransferase PlsY